MDIRPIGALFTRLDPNGNVTTYDSAGNALASYRSGLLSTVGNLSVNYITSNTITTSSTTLISTGFGLPSSFTPRISTKAQISLYAKVNNNTANGVVTVAVYRNTTGVPALGTGPGTDTLIGNTSTTPNNLAAGLAFDLSLFIMDKAALFLNAGLVVGTAYFYYVAFAVNNGTNIGSLANATLLVEEI
jgi:hypothetical protein